MVKTSNLPQGPWKLPFIGSIHHLIDFLPHHRLREPAQKYGPLMHLKLGEVSTIVVSSPKVAEEVLKTYDAIFAQRPHQVGADIMCYGSTDIATAPYGVIEWAISELMKNPTVMIKAQEEGRKVFGSKGYTDETALEELKFLKAVIKETLRLHPPFRFLPRECREACEIGRDSKYWSEAEKFYPERFMNCPIDYRGSNIEFIPFGAGRRICPGILFGISSIELCLARLL
ncbi:monooxygenase protein [Spatholobus suberectus]|nr:monooxygenase protein [Spatholobus suberectus]